MKLKTHVITLSMVFPATHPRKGQPTNFRAAFNNAQMCAKCRKSGMCCGECIVGYLKKHTLRKNYGYWHGIFEEINRGEACLSVRVWSGKPYRSKQVEIMKLTREDGIGLQKLCFPNRSTAWVDYPEKRLSVDFNYLAENDGLSIEDWCDWFRHYDLSEPLAIIHFTNFRY